MIERMRSISAPIVMEGVIIASGMGTESAGVSVLAARLVAEARAGDRDSFGRLVGPLLAPAIGAATLITGSQADGADAVQDALLIAWQRLPQLRDEDRFASWFRSIVLRAALRATRRSRRIVELDMEIAAPTDQLDHALDLRTLRRSLGRLDEKDRVVLTLHHYWALPVAETAGLLGIPEGTVKSRVHHALIRLRAAYEAEERR
jgi:RNA polymerase sigma-70 factor (ECF subfamily)